jgi:tetratricopeptide (TPR) repeat protein
MVTHSNFDLTPQSNPLTLLKQALASYDETITLSNSLPLEDLDNRHRLAETYLQRGEVWQTLGNVEPDAFSKALASYDQAIQLARDLPIDSPESRKLLAETYKKRGDVLRLVGTQALETEDELTARRKRYDSLRSWLQERIATGDAEYDERVGGLLEAELERA